MFSKLYEENNSEMLKLRDGISLHTNILLVLTTILGLGLRLFQLGGNQYYDDEIITTLASRRLPNVILTQMIGYDTHPPGYHLLVHTWAQLFGDSLIAIRMLSVLISTLCIPVVYLLGKAFADWRVGNIAALCMAIAPFQIMHGQQARMYPLLTIITMLAILATYQTWHNGRWRWIMLAIICIVGFYTHIYFVFSFISLTIWALIETIRIRTIYWPRLIRFCIAQIIACISFFPILQQIINLTQSVTSGFWIRVSTPFDWVNVLVNLINLASYGINSHTPIISIISIISSTIALFIIIAILSLFPFIIRDKSVNVSAWIFLYISVFMPIIISTAISLLVEPIILDRALIGLSGPLFVIISWICIRLKTKAASIILFTLVTASMLGMTTLMMTQPRLHNTIQDLAADLANATQPGDAIAVGEWQTFDTLVLLQPQLKNIYTIPSTYSPINNWRKRMEYLQWPYMHQIASVQDFARGYKRVWFVVSEYNASYEYLEQHEINWLRQHGRLKKEYDYVRAKVFLWEMAP